MKKRHIYSTSNADAAKLAVRTVRTAGVPDDDISIVARHDIEREAIPSHRQEPEEHVVPGALKGILTGGGSGLLAGIVAVSVAPIGLTLAGVAAMTVAGSAIGAWAGMLTGAAEPDTVRRSFENEIEAGHVLVIIDGDDELLAAVAPEMSRLGATQLPFEVTTAIS
jgi:hypothetical protein